MGCYSGGKGRGTVDLLSLTHIFLLRLGVVAPCGGGSSSVDSLGLALFLVRRVRLMLRFNLPSRPALLPVLGVKDKRSLPDTAPDELVA